MEEEKVEEGTKVEVEIDESLEQCPVNWGFCVKPFALVHRIL